MDAINPRAMGAMRGGGPRLARVLLRLLAIAWRDLVAVAHGFGVFLFNNPRKSTGELGRWPGTKLYRPEYLSEPMLGYALAHIAWHRDEERSAIGFERDRSGIYGAFHCYVRG